MNLLDQLNKFIAQYVNQGNVGDTPQNKGQCVGLIEVWIDQLNGPHDWGNAKDLLANADTSFFDVVYNDPNDVNQIPVPGDIMVWGPSWGGGDGHTGVLVTATKASTVFTCFEQNNPAGHVCWIVTHNTYTGILGWLHPKITAAPVDTCPQDRDTNWNMNIEIFAALGVALDPNDKSGSVKRAVSTIQNLQYQVSHTPTPPSPVPPTVQTDYKPYLVNIKGVVNGKPPWWDSALHDTRIDQIKAQIIKSGV